VPNKDESKTPVSLIRCTDYSPPRIRRAIKEHFSHLGGIAKFISKGDKVLLKPNFIIPRPTTIPAQTHPAIIVETARLLKDLGAKPFVGDSPSWSDTYRCARALELTDSLKKLDVPLRHFNKSKQCEIPLAGVKVGISSIALEADRIVNLPKLKTHQQLTATFAVKNMFGCVCGKEKAFWHFAKGDSFEGFCKLLIGIYQLLNPCLTIIDGVVAMQGQGPIRGEAKNLGYLIAGPDPIACEIICCQLVNFDPADLPVIATAKKIDFGTAEPNRIELIGDDFQNDICTDFKHALPSPLSFSLPRIFKSVTRQLTIRIKTLIHRQKK
jgi:uncharacterized protein (DUF362 family)